MPTTITAPLNTTEPISHESPVVELSSPICPDCGSTEIVKNGTYQRNPHGPDAPVRVQRYLCRECPGSFSASLSWINDGDRYPCAVRKLVRVVNAFTDTSLERLQDTTTVYYGVRPSDQQIHSWITETAQTGEIVANDLPVYSGIYTYDEQYLRIDGERVYRLTVYNDLMQAPVAEQLADRCTKAIVREFLQTALAERPTYVIMTDGRSDYADIIEENLDAFHHRCQFHFLANGERKLRNEVFRSVRHSQTEKVLAAVVWSEFKQVFTAPTYERAVRRFEAVLDKVKQLPGKLRAYVEEVMEEFDKFALHLRDEWVPSTTNNLERYYGHTKPTQIKRRFRSREHARSFLQTQMHIRTMKQGLVSREWSLAVGRELSPELDREQLTALFTETKQRFLWLCDIKEG